MHEQTNLDRVLEHAIRRVNRLWGREFICPVTAVEIAVVGRLEVWVVIIQVEGLPTNRMICKCSGGRASGKDWGGEERGCE